MKTDLSVCCGHPVRIEMRSRSRRYVCNLCDQPCDLADTGEAQDRQRFLVKMLQLAWEEGRCPWDELVRRALQYSASVRPRVKRTEFDAVRELTVGDLYGGN